MAKNKKKVWTDGLVQPKTASNPKGGGRVAGRDYSHLTRYPGSLAEHRLSYCRMKAQAKFRKETWDISWDQYQEIWESKWHLRGSEKGGLCLTRIDWAGPWNIDNISITMREDHWKKQRSVQVSKKGSKRVPYGPRKPKV